MRAYSKKTLEKLAWKFHFRSLNVFQKDNGIKRLFKTFMDFFENIPKNVITISLVSLNNVYDKFIAFHSDMNFFVMNQLYQFIILQLEVEPWTQSI